MSDFSAQFSDWLLSTIGLASAAANNWYQQNITQGSAASLTAQGISWGTSAALSLTNAQAAILITTAQQSIAANAASGTFSLAAFRNLLTATTASNAALNLGIGLQFGALVTVAAAKAFDYYNNPTEHTAVELSKAIGQVVYYTSLASFLYFAGVPVATVIAIAGPATFVTGLVFANYDVIAAKANELIQIVRDPLVLDLDGDGIELVSLADSKAHFDYGGDGFAERTGWVRPDDGILVFDRNQNGTVDGIGELFGSATEDGFEVLDTLDSNHDGVINAADAEFANLRVWRDLDEDGVSDAGELMTLAELGIESIDLDRTDVTGTNQGHDRGYNALARLRHDATSTRTNGTTVAHAFGTTGSAETIYFQTARQDTRDLRACGAIDNTPNFTAAAGVDLLPQLAGSGNIYSMAYRLSNDAAFRTAWTAFTDGAAGMSEAARRRGLGRGVSLVPLRRFCGEPCQ